MTRASPIMIKIYYTLLLLIITLNIRANKVTITTYNPSVEQCQGNPLITACGRKIDINKLKKKQIKYCVLSRDLLRKYPFHSFIYIEGWGIYEVVDTMNKRYKNSVDILQHKTEKNTKQYNITIKAIKIGDGKYEHI